MSESLIQPTQGLIVELLSRNISGEVVMLNLLPLVESNGYPQ